MADWEHYINEIQKKSTNPEIYLVTGTTIDNLIYIYREWSHTVNSKGALVDNANDHYYNTKLKECVIDYLDKQGGRLMLSFELSKTDIVYHASVNGDICRQE